MQCPWGDTLQLDGQPWAFAQFHHQWTDPFHFINACFWSSVLFWEGTKCHGCALRYFEGFCFWFLLGVNVNFCFPCFDIFQGSLGIVYTIWAEPISFIDGFCLPVYKYCSAWQFQETDVMLLPFFKLLVCCSVAGDLQHITRFLSPNQYFHSSVHSSTEVICSSNAF